MSATRQKQVLVLGQRPPTAEEHSGGQPAHGQVFSQREWDELSTRMSLSPQQKAVGQMLVNGHSDRQIALRLGIGMPTVRTHITRLFAKQGVADRVEFVVLCFSRFRRNRGELPRHP